MSFITSAKQNFYRAAGPMSRSVSDRNLPFYISTGNITISGNEPDILWVQSSLIPTSGSVYRVWNLEMVASTTIVQANDPIVVTIDVGFPLQFKEGVPLTGNFSISSSPQLYNALRYWSIESIDSLTRLTLENPSSLSIGTGYVQFFLNFFMYTNIL